MLKDDWINEIFDPVEDPEEPLSAYELNTIEKLNRFLIEISSQLMFLLISSDERLKDLDQW